MIVRCPRPYHVNNGAMVTAVRIEPDFPEPVWGVENPSRKLLGRDADGAYSLFPGPFLIAARFLLPITDPDIDTSIIETLELETC